MAWQARTDSEQESNDGAGTSRKPQKRAPAKIQPSASKGSEGLSLFHPQAVGSNYGGLTLLKKKRSGGMMMCLKLILSILFIRTSRPRL